MGGDSIFPFSYTFIMSCMTSSLVAAVVPKVRAWFRDFHQHPELGLEEVRTSGIVAAHLRSLGLEVRTGVGKTGVVGLVKGSRPGPTVALRADMDALPVTEKTGLPYASTARTVYRGEEVGMAPHRLRGAEKEEAPRFQNHVEEGDEPLLHVGIEVDEEVAADEEVEL